MVMDERPLYRWIVVISVILLFALAEMGWR
jgi:hypothetical protein